VRGTPTIQERCLPTTNYPTTLGRPRLRTVRAGQRSERDQTYKSIDVSVFKRLSKNWQLLASYSGTRRNVPIMVNPTPTATGTEFNGNVESGALNSNAEINASENGWESSTKLSGVYRFPFSILASANFERRSGYLWARWVRFTGGKTSRTSI